jgi:hypothetical protein
VARLIQERVGLDGAFRRAEARPRTPAQTQGAGRALARQEAAWDPAAVCWRHGLAAPVEGGQAGAIPRGGPPCMGRSSGGPLGRLQAERGERVGLGGQGADDSPQAGTSSDLRTAHCAQLTPAAQDPAWASGTLCRVQGLELRWGNPCYHLGQAAVTLGHGGVSADPLYGFGQIIVQNCQRDSADVRRALVEDTVTSDREASATPTA